MDIDIELYKIFYAVAKFENITKAAESLYISQPAVTMSIKKLEEALGVILFIRTKRGVILTNEGNVLYSYVSQAMENLKIGREKIELLKNYEIGNIRIGIGSTLAKNFILDYLSKFHELYPNIQINIITDMTEINIKNLENGSIDIAVVSTEKSSFKGLKIEYEKELHDAFVANKQYLDIIGRKVKLEELNNYPLLLLNSKSSVRQFLDKWSISNRVKLNSIMDFTSYSLIIEFAKIGIGVGFITKEYIKKELKSKELFEIDV